MLATVQQMPPSASHRRLSSRRGSVAAADPFAKHPLEPRPSSSTLTIVRVVSPLPLPSPALSLQEPPSSPVLNQRRLHRRVGSGPDARTPPAPGDPPARLSFAFSSFAGPKSPSPSTSPSSSPHLRPSSPHRNSVSSLSLNNPRLTPDQLYDLARQAQVPRFISPAVSPSIYPRSHSPHGHVFSPPAVTAATFTVLPDNIYLPFIDRPSEVLALISSHPSLKLFSLLAQTFPTPSPSPAPSNELPSDPTKWTYTHLHTWLTQVDRAVAPDPLWVFNARRCVMSHSELIWERIKGALGVPPELDVGHDYGDELVFSDDDVSEDEGRRGVGHWEDWDAVMDSPVFARKDVSADADVEPLSDHGQIQGITISPPPTIIQQMPTPNPDDGDHFLSPTLSIEPLLTPSSANPPPLSLPSALSLSDGLGDIAEGAEDDAEEDPKSQPAQDEGLIDPTQIQGLRISTSPRLSNTPTAINSPILSPISPLPPYPSTHAQIQHTKSRSSSISSSVASPNFRRSGSFGSLAAALERGDDVPYNPVGERGPGNPLFPSNFARLALGPTLSANNPALRSPMNPPLPRYGALVFDLDNVGGKSRTYSHGSAGGRGRGQRLRTRSWGITGEAMSRGDGHDYAITVGSASSACGE